MLYLLENTSLYIIVLNSIIQRSASGKLLFPVPIFNVFCATSVFNNLLYHVENVHRNVKLLVKILKNALLTRDGRNGRKNVSQ